ncbi:MAG: ATP-binding cassette domain-containing protein [Acidobacteria bacterium]|nr:ATP-binding cassette domain-containing protein [Acidobacteriota bacterium]
MIELSDVSKHFGAIRAVESVSLTITPGEPVVLAGPSGSGKTTLLRLIAGLELPDSGSIRIHNQVASLPGWALAPHLRHVAMVFQEPALWPHMTAGENVRFAARTPARAAEFLEQTEATHLARRYPGELSAGEAGRVALARALAAEADCLLLDEPLAHFDPALKARQLALILRSARVLVYVTHDPAEAAEIPGRRLELRSGRP